MMSENSSFSLPKVDVNGFILQTSMVVAYPYVSSIILSIILADTVGMLWN